MLGPLTPALINVIREDNTEGPPLKGPIRKVKTLRDVKSLLKYNESYLQMWETLQN